jgi:hypothetical protein
MQDIKDKTKFLTVQFDIFQTEKDTYKMLVSISENPFLEKEFALDDDLLSEIMEECLENMIKEIENKFGNIKLANKDEFEELT